MIINDWAQLKIVSEFVASFLQNGNVFNYNDGFYSLDEGIKLSIETYRTEYRKNRQFESHMKYLDVQFIIDGEELIAIADKNDLTEKTEYDSNKDIVFYKELVEGKDIYLCSGMFAIFDTNDAHMPCICVNNISKVRKAVFKIPV